MPLAVSNHKDMERPGGWPGRAQDEEGWITTKILVLRISWKIRVRSGRCWEVEKVDEGLAHLKSGHSEHSEIDVKGRQAEMFDDARKEKLMAQNLSQLGSYASLER